MCRIAGHAGIHTGKLLRHHGKHRIFCLLVGFIVIDMPECFAIRIYIDGIGPVDIPAIFKMPAEIDIGCVIASLTR